MALTTVGLLARLTSPYPKESGTNNYRLADAIYTGYFSHVKADLDSLRLELLMGDATTIASLERLQEGWLDMPPKPGEALEAYRIRLLGEVARRIIVDPTPDEVLSALLYVIGGTGSDIVLTENVHADGTWEPAYARFTVDLARLAVLGFEESEFAAILDDLETIAQRIMPAGVGAEVDSQGGAVYDGSDVFDGDDVYGS